MTLDPTYKKFWWKMVKNMLKKAILGTVVVILIMMASYVATLYTALILVANGICNIEIITQVQNGPTIQNPFIIMEVIVLVIYTIVAFLLWITIYRKGFQILKQEKETNTDCYELDRGQKLNFYLYS